MRVSSFPTLHGERAVVRLFAAPEALLYLESLGLPEEMKEYTLPNNTRPHGIVDQGPTSAPHWRRL